MICRSGIKCKAVPVNFNILKASKNPLYRNTCHGLAFFRSPDRLNWIFFSYFEGIRSTAKTDVENFKNRKCGDEGEKADPRNDSLTVAFELNIATLPIE